jgi:hypothetical protein
LPNLMPRFLTFKKSKCCASDTGLRTPVRTWTGTGGSGVRNANENCHQALPIIRLLTVGHIIGEVQFTS